MISIKTAELFANKDKNAIWFMHNIALGIFAKSGGIPWIVDDVPGEIDCFVGMDVATLEKGIHYPTCATVFDKNGRPISFYKPKKAQKGEKINVADMCRSFQDTAVGIVLDRASKAIKQYEIKQVVLAGGVSANSYLREQMKIQCDKLGANIIIPPMWCCTDNAAMIAKVAEHLYEMKVFAGLDLGVDPNWSIEKWNEFEN
jgi:hypothetical protein